REPAWRQGVPLPISGGSNGNSGLPMQFLWTRCGVAPLGVVRVRTPATVSSVHRGPPPTGSRRTRREAREANMWTDDRVDQLKSLWTEGLSASQIARALGEGITRNAVIGKVHRLGLAGR